MPYARKSYRKRPYRKGGLKKAVRAAVKYVMPKAEIKKISIPSADTTYGDAVATTGTVVHISNIDQGSDVNDRQGLRVSPKYIMMRYAVNNADDTTPPIISSDSSMLIRVLLVQDNQQNATAPTLAQVLSTVNPFGNINVAYVGRFSILYDRVHTLYPHSATIAAAQPANTVQQYVQKYIKLNPKKTVVFTSTVGTNISNGNIYLMYLRGDDFNSTTDSNFGRINYNIRLGYCDL